jgi:hypothetical protein
MSGFAEYTRNEIGGMGPGRAAEMAKSRNSAWGYPLVTYRSPCRMIGTICLVTEVIRP